MPVFDSTKRIRATDEREYFDYLGKTLLAYSDADFIAFCADVLRNLLHDDPDFPQVGESNAARIQQIESVLADLNKLKAASQKDPKAEELYLLTKTGIYNVIKSVIKAEGVVLFDQKDAANFSIIDVEDAKYVNATMTGFFSRIGNLNQAIYDYKNRCLVLQSEYVEEFKDAAFAVEFERLNKEFAEVSAKLVNDLKLIQFIQMSESHGKLLKNIKAMDKLLHQHNIHDVEYELKFVYLMYCLNILTLGGRIAAALVTLKYAAWRWRRYGYAAVVSACRNAKYMADLAGAGMMAGLRGALAVATSPVRKFERLMGQEGFGSALYQEFERFSKDAREIFMKAWAEGLRTNEAFIKIGRHAEHPLNVAGAVLGGAVMLLYIPTKVTAGMLNERYSFLNQVKLGVTGSLMGDKTKNSGFKVVATDETKTSNNTKLLVTTDNYSIFDPTKHDQQDFDVTQKSGAAAIIHKEKEGGYSVFLVSHSLEDCERMLALLCKAVKDSDGKQLIITTSIPLEEPEKTYIDDFIAKIKEIQQDPNPKPEDKGLDFRGRDFSITVNAEAAEVISTYSRKKHGM